MVRVIVLGCLLASKRHRAKHAVAVLIRCRIITMCYRKTPASQVASFNIVHVACRLSGRNSSKLCCAEDSLVHRNV